MLAYKFYDLTQTLHKWLNMVVWGVQGMHKSRQVSTYHATGFVERLQGVRARQVWQSCSSKGSCGGHGEDSGCWQMQ